MKPKTKDYPPNDLKDINDILAAKDTTNQILNAITTDKHLQEDILQDFYLKYLENPKPINKFFLYAALKNIFVSIKRKEQTQKKLSGKLAKDAQIVEVEYDTIEDLNKQYLMEEVLLVINKEKYLNKELFKLNKIDKISVKKISDDTKINKKVINYAITTVKQSIINNKEIIETYVKEKIIKYEKNTL